MWLVILRKFLSVWERHAILVKSLFKHWLTFSYFWLPIIFFKNQYQVTLLLHYDNVSSCQILLHQNSAGWMKPPGKSHHLQNSESHLMGYNLSPPKRIQINVYELWWQKILPTGSTIMDINTVLVSSLYL